MRPPPLAWADDGESPVDLQYRLRGVAERSMSPAPPVAVQRVADPTMTMAVGLAQHLADQSSSRKEPASALASQSLEATHTQSALT